VTVMLASANVVEEVEMRAVFANTLMELARAEPRIMLLDADLMVAAGTQPFAAEFPQRTVDCGVMEANMAGVAAGLSVEGFIPFMHTFAAFCSRRALDQIWLSCAYALENVKIIGSDPGVAAALNGGTHMSFEDMGIMRMIPGATVVDPTDSVMLTDMLRKAASSYGIWYIRLFRRNAVRIYSSGSSFEIGKACKLREGTDVSLVACGICVHEALRAHELLKQQGIDASVIDAVTVKPLDRGTLLAEAKRTGRVVTCENHSCANGLGSAVAEVLAEEGTGRLARIGVREDFGEVGPVDYLKRRFRLTGEDIAEAAAGLVLN
jgi:transketolase